MVIRARSPIVLAKPGELKESDNRFTSPVIVEAVRYAFDRIDFDPCYHKASAVHPRAYLDVRRGDDGLRDDWSGGVAFVNPPWSQQLRFLERAYDQWRGGNVATVVCLVPAKTDTSLFREILANEADVYFIAGRPKFFKEDGSVEATSVSTMAVLFGATREQRERFAERIAGVWLRPNRISAVTPAGIPTSTQWIVKDYSVMSCIAPQSRSYVPRLGR